jgi:hypothetical protein
MGVIGDLFAILFGNGRNLVRETAGVFVEHAEDGARRASDLHAATLAQFGAEFHRPAQGGFDRFMDGVNRIPRPALALGTLGLFVVAMVDPLWFAARMQGLALVPEPLWWLLGVIVSFYFGARHQKKSQDFQKEIGSMMTHVPDLMRNVEALRQTRSVDPGVAEATQDPSDQTEESNKALAEWRAGTR